MFDFFSEALGEAKVMILFRHEDYEAWRKRVESEADLLSVWRKRVDGWQHRVELCPLEPPDRYPCLVAWERGQPLNDDGTPKPGGKPLYVAVYFEPVADPE